MDFEYNETQTAVSQLSKKIFKARVTPDALKKLDATEERFAAPLWKDLAQAGLLGTALPDDVGGSDGGFLELCALLVEAGSAIAPLPLWQTLLCGALPIDEFGSDEQRQELLTGVVTGKTILTAAFAEDGNADPAAPTTTASEAGGAWTVTGAKAHVPATHIAHRVLLTAKTGDDTIGVFLVDPKADGVTLEGQTTTTGEPEHYMNLDGVAAEPLGDPTGGAAILDWLMPRAVVGLCALELGVAKRVLVMTAKYTAERTQFDRPIATFQAVGQRAADAYIDVESVKLTMWEAAWRLSQGLPAAQQVAIAKFWAAEGGHRVAFAAQHLHAGIGYDLDYPLARYYMMSKKLELTLGSANAHLAELGAALAAD
jgi:hypothetical protein